jgi:mitochondrial cardiolipin hydrolase
MKRAPPVLPGLKLRRDHFPGTKLKVFLVLLLGFAAMRASAEEIEAFFSPGEAWLNAIVQEISKATSSVRVMTSELNSKDIAGALAAARVKNVDVIVMLDQERIPVGGRPTRSFLADKGVLILTNKGNPIESNIVLIDDETVLCGSAPFTYQATQGAANLVVIRQNAKVINYYINHWNENMSRTAKVTAFAEPLKRSRCTGPRKSRGLTTRFAAGR